MAHATPQSPFDDGDGQYPNRPAWSMGGNTDKLLEPRYGSDMAGNSTLTNLDEREVMSDTVSAVSMAGTSPDPEVEWCGSRQGVYGS